MHRLCANERGFVMITTLALLLMFGLMGVSMVKKSSDDMKVSSYQMRDLNALYASEAGCDQAFALFNASIDSVNKPPDPLPSDSFDVDRYKVVYRVDKVGAPVTRTLTKGAYRGLYGLVQDYDIWGYARSDATGVQNSVRIRMERALIPIFQFAIFYDDVLEWHPGPIMTLSGRVHSNGDLYLGANSGLTINSFVTAGGGINHGRHPASGQATGGGYVRIEDEDGVDQDMQNADGTWLDHGDADWLDESMDRWDGLVQDSDHGMTTLELPLETSDDPHAIIETAAGGNSDSYENQATLKVVDGQAFFKSGGSWIDVTADMVAQGSLKTASFYDSRESQTVSSLDIDIAKLNLSPYWPTNGILYTSESAGAFPATRLISGATLKEGLTVVSENPVYTLGNYNTVNKKPAAVMTDAYTVLSKDWDDAKSTLSLANRVAGSTTANVSFISGYVPSAGGNYSGGVENFPRFLEKWDGKTFKWAGSMVQMWLSEQADSPWSYGSYYTAPNRDWDFDTDLLNPDKLPPGTPMVNAVVKRGWTNTGGPIAEEGG